MSVKGWDLTIKILAKFVGSGKKLDDIGCLGFKQQKTRRKQRSKQQTFIYEKHRNLAAAGLMRKNMAPITKTQHGSLTSRIQNVDRKKKKPRVKKIHASGTVNSGHAKHHPSDLSIFTTSFQLPSHVVQTLVADLSQKANKKNMYLSEVLFISSKSGIPFT